LFETSHVHPKKARPLDKLRAGYGPSGLIFRRDYNADVLSQRTVGRYQRLLGALFTPVGYGICAPLDTGSYYNLLYQEGIRRELLDFLGNEYNFAPGPVVLALHEGEAIERVNRDVDWNHSVSRETTREIGDIYLLVFASVALRQFEQYTHPMPYLE
jgi:hypothetical protein